MATYQPNALNQYDTITTGATTAYPDHDDDGNLENDGSKIYLWDAENRLVSVERASDNEEIASYAYDYMGRRIYKKTTALAPQGASETVFLYDGWNLVCEYSVSNHQPSIKRAYTWGLDLSGSLQGAGGVGGLLAIEHKDSGSSLQGVYYPLYDGNGNVLAALHDTGSTTAVDAAYHYDPFGETLLSSGDYAAENPFRFSTKYFDQETGFYYYGYRFYDPVTGRWPSRDLIGEKGGANLHGFVGNNAVNRLDILGLAELVDCEKRCESAGRSGDPYACRGCKELCENENHLTEWENSKVSCGVVIKRGHGAGNKI